MTLAGQAPAGHTPGPWKRIALGGSSTVVAAVQPERNDTRIPPHGYDERNGHCIGYPCIEDDGRCRWDFVLFSHADAALIVRAVNCHAELLEALRDLLPILDNDGPLASAYADVGTRARAALSRATGSQP